MKKSNSDIKTAFVSESGSELTNKDYFAYVEMDDYACYVLASSITDFDSGQAAQEAVEHLILSFQEKPSISKGSLLQYMKETNERLLNVSSREKLKASVIMFVTDYEKCRYIMAGNVRLRMYRSGRFLTKSMDMSLANDLVEKGETETPLDRHEERNNLYAYLGKKDFFHPFVSKVQKLADSDIIALYSKGLWENVDEQEIDEIFSEASDEPQESVDALEDLILSRQPENLQSYSIVAIFINKFFRDPEREHKRLLYIKIAVITLIIIILLSIIGYLFYSWRKGKVEDYQKTVAVAMEYMDKNNYKRAQENCQIAIKMATDLKLTDEESKMKEYLELFDKILEGDNYFDDSHFRSAYESYIDALKQSSLGGKNVAEYLGEKLLMVEHYFVFDEFMILAQRAIQENQFDDAEALYIKAQERASVTHDVDKQQKVFEALEALYDKKAKLLKDNQQQLDDKKQVAISDAMKKGDELLAAGDLEGAQIAYLQARNLSDNPADRQITSNALGQIYEAREKKILDDKVSKETLKKMRDEAFELEKQGDTYFDDKEYLTAQMYYMRAIEVFGDLHENEIAQTIRNKYELSGSKYLEIVGKKVQAEDIEERAREFYADKNFAQAQTAAMQAKQLYTELNFKSKVEEMDILLQQIGVDIAIGNALQ